MDYIPLWGILQEENKKNMTMSVNSLTIFLGTLREGNRCDMLKSEKERKGGVFCEKKDSECVDGSFDSAGAYSLRERFF